MHHSSSSFSFGCCGSNSSSSTNRLLFHHRQKQNQSHSAKHTFAAHFSPVVRIVLLVCCSFGCSFSSKPNQQYIIMQSLYVPRRNVPEYSQPTSHVRTERRKKKQMNIISLAQPSGIRRKSKCEFTACVFYPICVCSLCMSVCVCVWHSPWKRLVVRNVNRCRPTTTTTLRNRQSHREKQKKKQKFYEFIKLHIVNEISSSNE